MLKSYFDKVYILNQDSRPDRWAQFEEEAARIGLTGYERVATIPADQPYQSFCLSQQNLLKTFVNSGGVNLLALEDDCIFRPLSHFQEAMSELPSDWDLLYLGANVFEEKPERVNKHLFRLRSAWTSHAIAYSRKAAEYIAEHYPAGNFIMFDEWIRVNVQSTMNCYLIQPMVAWQRPCHSDLWGHWVSYGWQHIDKKLSEL